jgi:hypothetical protein
MAEPIPQSTPGPTIGRKGQRAVIVAVGSPDRRTMAALECASWIDADVRRAVHVATDSDDVDALGTWWMDVQPFGFALEMVDDGGDIASSVAASAHEQVAAGFEEVVVVVGSLCMHGVSRRRLLHDRTAEAISAAVAEVEGACSLLVPIWIA